MASLLSIVGLSVIFLLVVPQALGQPYAGSSWTETGYIRRPLEPVFYSFSENMEIVQLENGLMVLLMQNPAQPMVGIYTQVKVGSAYENFRTSGMTHMLEHLLFNGTEKFSQEELYALADRNGAYNNAHTTDFYTNYLMVLPAEALEVGLEIQSQMLFHSVLPEDKFTKEKGIVLGELVSNRDMPGYRVDNTMREVLYQGSSLALPTLGTRSTIEHMSRDDVYAFYKLFYVPNNMTLTMAGRFDREEALALLEKYYGTLSPGTLDQLTLQPVYSLDRTRSVVRRGGPQRVLALVFDAPSYNSSDFFPFLVATRLLDAPGSGILTRALSDLEDDERAQLTVRWEKAEGFARLVLRFDLPPAADPNQYWRLVQDAGAAALEFGIDDDDVQEIVKVEETETLLQREQLRQTGIYIAEPIILGGLDFYVSYLERLRNVEAESVARVLDSYVIENPCLAVLIEPGEEADTAASDKTNLKMPPGMKIPPAMKQAIQQQGMTAAQGRTESAAADSGGFGYDRPTDSAQPNMGPLPVDRTVLGNGAILVTQQNRVSPLMAIHLTVRNRAVVDDGHPGALNVVHRLLSSGIGGCDEICLSRKLRRLGAVVKFVDNPDIPMDNYYTTGRFSFIRVEVTADNGLAVLELLAEMTQHASFSAEDFNRERQEQIALLENRRNSARTKANRLLNETLYGQHPLALPAEGTVEDLQELSYDDARTIYRRAFAPQNLIFAIVSPHPHELLAGELEDLLPGRGRPTDGLPLSPVTETSDYVTASVGSEMAAIRMGSLFTVAPGDAKALEILTGILSDRMAMDLRETRGLSYSVGATISVDGGDGLFTAWINPPREKAAVGEQALAQFVADFDPLSITHDELDKIRNAKLGRWMMRLLASMSQAYYLAMAELNGNVTQYLEMLSGYDQLTQADLQRVWGTYLAELPLVTVVVD